MNKIDAFKAKRQDCAMSVKETESIKGGFREFLKKGTGNPVNHARYRYACRCAESIMLVTLSDGEYFCIDW
jgi:hypothetical protein